MENLLISFEGKREYWKPYHPRAQLEGDMVSNTPSFPRKISVNFPYLPSERIVISNLHHDQGWEREIWKKVNLIPPCSYRENWKLISISPSPEIERGRYGIRYPSHVIQLQGQGLFQQFLPVDMTYGSGVMLLLNSGQAPAQQSLSSPIFTWRWVVWWVVWWVVCWVVCHTL